MPKRAVFERSRRELSLDVSVGVHILLVVEQSSLESQSRGCATLCITHVHYIPLLVLIVGVGKREAGAHEMVYGCTCLKRQHPLLELP